MKSFLYLRQWGNLDPAETWSESVRKLHTIWRPSQVAAAIAILARSCGALTLSSKMIHRFSDEARGIWRDRHGGAEPVHWPRRGSVEYYGMLWSHDIKRSLQRRELLAEYQSLYFSQGSETIQYGESLGWSVR